MQHINLYQVEEEAEEVLLCLKHIIKISIGFACFLMLIAAFSFYSAYSQQSQLESLKKQQADLSKGISTAKQSAPSEDAQDKLKQQITKLEEQRRSRLSMYNTLSKLQYGESRGYSRFMLALSNYSIPGIWFTGITVKGDGTSVVLEGQTEDNNLIGVILKRLSNDPSFDGKAFESFTITLEKDTRSKEQKLADKAAGIDGEPKILNFTIGSK